MDSTVQDTPRHRVHKRAAAGRARHQHTHTSWSRGGGARRSRGGVRANAGRKLDLNNRRGSAEGVDTCHTHTRGRGSSQGHCPQHHWADGVCSSGCQGAHPIGRRGRTRGVARKGAWGTGDHNNGTLDAGGAVCHHTRCHSHTSHHSTCGAGSEAGVCAAIPSNFSAVSQRTMRNTTQRVWSHTSRTKRSGCYCLNGLHGSGGQAMPRPTTFKWADSWQHIYRRWCNGWCGCCGRSWSRFPSAFRGRTCVTRDVLDVVPATTHSRPTTHPT